MEQEKKGIKDSLEILEYIHGICIENQLKYTLMATSLLAAGEKELPDFLNIIQIAMLYDDYQVLMEKLEASDGVFYSVTNESDSSFREMFCRVYKKSGISLPTSRRKEQRFYDSFVNVFPVYQVADTEKEYKKVFKEYLFYKKCIAVREGLKKTPFKLKKWKVEMKRKRYLKHRTDGIVKETNDYLASTHRKGAKYVLIPDAKVLQGINKEAVCYEQVEECDFGGIRALKVKDIEEWIKQYWSVDELEKIQTAQTNIVLQQGMTSLRRVQMVALDILVEFDRICRKYDIKYILAAGTLLGAIRHKGFIPWDDDVDVFMLYEEWLKFEQVYEKEIDSEKFFVRTQKTDADNNLCFFQIKRNGTVYCKEGRKQYNSHPGIPLDILPYFNSAPNRLLHKIQDRVCKFWKTVTWAHMGAPSEKKYLKRKIYLYYQKHITNKTASDRFFKVANKYKPSKYLTYVYVKRNPFRGGSGLRKYFEDLIEVEFEGKMFFAPREYDELLRYAYSDDYMMLPQSSMQINHHLPAHLELGDLHKDIEG